MAIGFIESSGNKNFNQNPYQIKGKRKFVVLPNVNPNETIEITARAIPNAVNYLPRKESQPLRKVNVLPPLIQCPIYININDLVLLDGIIDLYNN